MGETKSHEELGSHILPTTYHHHFIKEMVSTLQKGLQSQND